MGIERNNNKIITKAEKNSSGAIIQIIAVSVIAVIFSILIGLLILSIIRRTVSRVAKNASVTDNVISQIKKSIDQTAVSAQELDTSMNNANIP